MSDKPIDAAVLGRLRRGWGKWYAQLTIPQLAKPLEIWIETRRIEPVESYAQQAQSFGNRFKQLQAAFADELFENYQIYKEWDLREGVFTAADYAKYPAVSSSADVWRALTPYRLRLGPPIDKYMGNSYLLMDVAWPNPHYFQMFMDSTGAGFKYIHTEFVG